MAGRRSLAVFGIQDWRRRRWSPQEQLGSAAPAAVDAPDNAHAPHPSPGLHARADWPRVPVVQPRDSARSFEHYVSRAAERQRNGDWGTRAGGAACAGRPALHA
ncbi:uncharacterized protein LOC143668822 [Tamandua tetradactyla]|uniref:uncharacterized protein LOC143668822 n=1 Tax=Tamandua tetradactyla TaxID=48850 RepID=UPI004054332A